jgi:membrane fusion protein (multidrug efflux system)
MSRLDQRAASPPLDAALGAPEAATPPARRRLPWLRLGLAAAVLGACVVGGVWHMQVGRFLQSTDNATVQGDIATLSSRIEGHVAAILVADNTPVVAGQPLLRLADRAWRARLAEAEADLSRARAAVTTAERQIDQQQAVLAQMQAAIDFARAEAVRAQAELGRAGSLAGSGFTSRQAMERADADMQKARAGVTSAEAALAAATAQKAVLHASLAQARATEASLAAAAEVAQIRLDDTMIRAPFDGIAGNRATQLGQYVRPGQTLMAVAPEASALYVVANFKETQLSRMRLGQPATVAVDALGGAVMRGRLESFSPATGALFSLLPPENATGNFTKIVQRVPVRITLDAPPEAGLALRPGLSVTATIDTRAAPGGPTGMGAAFASLLGLGR